MPFGCENRKTGEFSAGRLACVDDGKPCVADRPEPDSRERQVSVRLPHWRFPQERLLVIDIGELV